MKVRVAITQLFACALIACICLPGTATAQNAQAAPGTERPMFMSLHPHGLRQPKNPIEAASTPLATWNGSFTSGGTTYNYNMVGTPPSGGASTSVQVFLIPVKIVISPHHGSKVTYDPSHVLSNGLTVTNSTVQSPVFTGIPFTSGGVSMGTTQYVDAYQRANFWGQVKNHTGYHVLLGGPTIEPVQTLSPPARSGKVGTVFGFKAGLVDINWFDAQIQSIITKLGIGPNTFPVFLTYDVYLTQNNSCCIGGYHSAFGLLSAPQSYAHATYVDHPTFAQNVSALSHEVGEWVDDPLVVNINGNQTPCGILENGDPLENNVNFGDFPFTGNNGFSYELQDLVTLPYFGAPPSTSVNNEFTFQGESLTVCQNGS